MRKIIPRISAGKKDRKNLQIKVIIIFSDITPNHFISGGIDFP